MPKRPPHFYSVFDLFGGVAQSLALTEVAAEMAVLLRVLDLFIVALCYQEFGEAGEREAGGKPSPACEAFLDSHS